jgi:2-dehydro-3-deoxyglucarate aldolase/4-hydroxy-2-oxoheptanedioate aldolase
MLSNPVKLALKSGETVVGTFLFEFPSPGLPHIARAAGAEFLLIDMEHTGWTLETVRRLIAATPAPELVPLVRVPSTEYHFIARALDMGAMGIMVPMVETAEQARRIVQSAKYPPAGRRGAAFGIAHDHYRPGPLAEKLQQANDEVLLIAQIETQQGLASVDDIAAVPGIDALWVGQTDLTCALQIPGQFEHPEFRNALERVVRAAEAHQKAAAYLLLRPDEADWFVQRGFRLLAYSGDVWIYQQALTSGLAAIRETIASRGA